MQQRDTLNRRPRCCPAPSRRPRFRERRTTSMPLVVFLLGVCPSNPSLRGEGAAGRCEAAGSKKPEAYSLKYVEDFFGPRTTQMAADYLPQENGMTRTNF